MTSPEPSRSADAVDQTKRLKSAEGYIRTYNNRFEDFRRHLIDLRDHRYEGNAGREEREATFRRPVELISPVVQDVLQRPRMHDAKGL